MIPKPGFRVQGLGFTGFRVQGLPLNPVNP